MTDTPFSPSQIAFLEKMFHSLLISVKNEVRKEIRKEIRQVRAEFKVEIENIKAMIRPLATRKEVIDHINNICEQLDARHADHRKLEVRVTRCETALGFAP